MAWLEIKLQAQSDHADALADAMIAAGALSVVLEDAAAGTPAESAQYAEPGLEPPRVWQHNVLMALIEAGANPAEVVAEAVEHSVFLPSFKFIRTR